MTWVVGLLLALSGAGAAPADVVQEVLKLTDGQRARIVWQRGQDAIVGLDTGDGKVRTLFSGEVGERSWPILSTDGQTLYFAVTPKGRGQVGTVYSITWDARAGTTPTEVGEGMAPVAVWRDPATGVEWLYVATKPGGDRRPSHFVRVRTDQPGARETVWDKTDMDAPFSLSADGRYGACQVQWPTTALVTMPNGEVFPGALPGCNSSILPDNSYRLFCLNASHTEVYLYRDLQLGQTRPYKVLSLKVDSKPVHRVRASNHPRLFTYFGPMAPNATYNDVFLAKFNADYTDIEATVRLTDDKAHSIENTLPYAWVELDDRSDFAYPLGQFHGEAPLPVTLPDHLADAGATWDFGDGQTAQGKRGTHTYEKPGEFAVKLQAGGQTFTGRVRVQPTEPPRVQSVQTLGINRLKVVFSEKVRADDARATLQSGNPVTGVSLLDSGKELILDLERPVAKTDQLILSGVTDRAAKPNALATEPVEVVRPAWPSDPQDIVALWDTQTAYALSPGSSRHAALVWNVDKLKPGGIYPIFDRYGRLILPTATDGAPPTLVADPEVLADTVGRSRAFSAELLFIPRTLTQAAGGRKSARKAQEEKKADAPVHLLGWYVGRESNPTPSFAISQLGSEIGVSTAGEGGAPAFHRVGSVEAGRCYHLVVTWQAGELSAYLDGKRVMNTQAAGDPLRRLGAVMIGGGDRWAPKWSGWVNAAALYSRALGEAEVAENFAACQAMLKKQAAAEYVLVRAKLLAVSQVPTPEKIAPYRNALVVNEYEVLEVLRGELPAKTVRVAEWGLYDTKTTRGWTFKPGHKATQDMNILLESFAGKPEQELLFDTLAEDFETPMMLRVEDWIQQ